MFSSPRSGPSMLSLQNLSSKLIMNKLATKHFQTERQTNAHTSHTFRQGPLWPLRRKFETWSHHHCFKGSMVSQLRSRQFAVASNKLTSTQNTCNYSKTQEPRVQYHLSFPAAVAHGSIIHHKHFSCPHSVLGFQMWHCVNWLQTNYTVLEWYVSMSFDAFCPCLKFGMFYLGICNQNWASLFKIVFDME